jgi:hypothetical protein
MRDPRMDAPSGGWAALNTEVQAARVLLEVQREVEEGIRAGRNSEDLLGLVRRQEEAARAAARAALERRRWFQGPDAFAAWLQTRPDEEARRVRLLAAEARELKGKIEQTSRRCQYLAERALEWSQGQMEAVIRAIDRGGPTYGGPAGRATSVLSTNLMDRIA